MARYAMVCTACGHVVNVIEWDGETPIQPPAGHEMIEDTEQRAGPGGLASGSTFEYAPPMEPTEQPAGETPAETP